MKLCPEREHLWKPVIWERSTRHVTSGATGLPDLSRWDTHISLSAWPPAPTGKPPMLFCLTPGGSGNAAGWVCMLGRRRFASISPLTSASPARGLHHHLGMTSQPRPISSGADGAGGSAGSGGWGGRGSVRSLWRMAGDLPGL